MEKIDIIKQYISGSRAFYLDYIGNMENDPSLKVYICDERNMIAAKVSLISTILLGIKEDIVLNKGNLNYESKLLLDSLENSVNFIATYKNGKYYVDNYEFDNAASVVATIRNSIAHGKYLIDFDNNELILIKENNIFKINIEKLNIFLIHTFSKFKFNTKSNEYERNFSVLNKVQRDRETPIKTVSELKNIIRNIEFYTFSIKSDNGPVPSICIEMLNHYISLFKDLKENNSKDYKYINEFYKKLELVCKKNNCKIEKKSKKGVNTIDEENIIKYSKEMIMNTNIPYREQINLIASEFNKTKDNTLTNFSPIFANIKLLIILDTIHKCKTSDVNVINEYLKNNNYGYISIGYDEVSALVISMFNTLFMYGLEDVYTNGLKYNLNKCDELDFSKLNLKNCNPSIDGIDYSSLNDARNKYNHDLKEYKECLSVISKKNNHLMNVKQNNNTKAIEQIEKKLKELNNNKNNLGNKLKESFISYTNIKNDYDKNLDYFKNKAIIEGIRNCISHGHYNIYSGDGLDKTKIVFEDIYNENITFKMEITLQDFLDIINNNYEIVLEYINNKEIEKQQESRSMRF